MKTIGSILLWTAVLALALVAADQTMVRLPGAPGDLRQAYLELRHDLLGDAALPGKPAPQGSPRYIYVDADGELHFVDSLQEIPPSFRSEAQRLKH